MPFITEELWQAGRPARGRAGDTVSFAPWPVSDPERIDRDALDEIEWLKAGRHGIRRVRSEMDVSPAKRRAAVRERRERDRPRRLDSHRERLLWLARLEAVRGARSPATSVPRRPSRSSASWSCCCRWRA